MRRLNKKRVALLTACVISAVANMAFAAEQGEMDVYEGADYVVTATKTPLEKKEVPQSVEVITREEIQNIGAISVRDVLKTATNLVIFDGGGGHGDKMSMRGGNSNDILLLVNGRRVAGENMYTNASGNDRILDRLNLSNVERVEIVRGTAGALYGSDAQSGVINIITSKPDKQSFTVGVATGSRETTNYYHWNSGRDGKVNAAVDASFGRMRDFSSQAEGFTRGPKQYYSLDLDYDADANNKVNFFVDYGKQKFNYDVSMKMGGKTYSYISYRDQERKSAAVTYNGKNANSDYSMSVSYSSLETTAWKSTNTTLDNREYKMWIIDARDSINTAANNKLTFGGEYKVNQGAAYIQTGDDRTNQYALYLQDEWRVGDKLLLVPSVRYNHHDTFGSHTSPNFGATYFVADNSRFKANYGSAYRAPSVDELYGVMGSHNSFFLYGNPDLKPEKTRGYELSYEHEFGKDTSSKLTYFKNKKEDAINFETIAGTKNYQYVNIDNTTSEGVEFELKHNLGKGFVLIGAYDWLSAKDDSTGKPLSYTARNTYTAKLAWEDPANTGWGVNVWNRWYSDFTDDGSTFVSGNTFNIAVNKRWGEKYRVFAALDNAFDKKISDLSFYGRLWRVGAEMTF